MTKGLIGLLAVAGGGIALSQWQANALLRTELAGLRLGGSSLDSLREENRRLAGLVPSPEALEKLRTEQSLAAGLRGEIDELKNRIEASAGRRSAGNAADTMIPSNAWKNAGRATPTAAFETGMWAAVNGELGTLASMLWFSPAANAKAEAMWARLPVAARANCANPDELIALMMAGDTAQGAMEVLGQTERGPNDAALHVRLKNAEGQATENTFTLHRGADGWQVMVSESMVEKYRAMLTAPAAAK